MGTNKGLTQEREREIRDIEAAATPGPWIWERVEEGFGLELAREGRPTPCDVDGMGELPVLGMPLGTFGGHRPYDNNRAFIATSRTAVPELFEEIDRLRAALAAALDAAWIYRRGMGRSGLSYEDRIKAEKEIEQASALLPKEATIG